MWQKHQGSRTRITSIHRTQRNWYLWQGPDAHLNPPLGAEGERAMRNQWPKSGLHKCLACSLTQQIATWPQRTGVSRMEAHVVYIFQYFFVVNRKDKTTQKREHRWPQWWFGGLGSTTGFKCIWEDVSRVESTGLSNSSRASMEEFWEPTVQHCEILNISQPSLHKYNRRALWTALPFVQTFGTPNKNVYKRNSQL